MAIRREFGSGLFSPGAARTFASAFVIANLQPIGWSTADHVAIVVSEYVTHAVQAGAGSIEVAVELHRTFTAVAVTADIRPGAVVAEPSPAADTRERIIGALTTGRGSHTTADGHLSWWANVGHDPLAAQALDCAIAT